MPSAALVCRRRRARSRSPPRRTRRRAVASAGVEAGDMACALPEDMLLEVFKRLPAPTGAIRCAAVCRRWRRAVSGAASGALPAPPRHLGFFRNYGPSPLPPFVPTAGVALDLGFVPVSRSCGAILLDARGHSLLLHELGPEHKTQLKLLVCNPLERTFARLPALPISGHTVACHTVVPGHGAEFRVVVVLFDATSPKFHVLIYSSASSAWETSTGALNRRLTPHHGPSVVVGDVVYWLQCDDKHIMAVNTTKMTLAAVSHPDAGMRLYTGNSCIGKTEDGRLCFFLFREPLLLLKWVLEPSGTWTPPQEPVALRTLMKPAAVGDLHGMNLSASIGDQLLGFKLVSFAGFCEGTGTLFFAMAERVVSLDLRTLEMERLWLNGDKWRPLGNVFPYEMVAWPPAIKAL